MVGRKPLERWTRALANAREHGDRAAELNALANMAFWLTHEGRYDEAKPYATEALTLARTLGNHTFEEERALYELGWIAFQQGELDKAEDLCHESVEVANTLPDDKRGELADRLWQVGEILCEYRGKREEGCQMLARAEAIYVEREQAANSKLTRAWAQERIQTVRDLRRKYGDESA